MRDPLDLFHPVIRDWFAARHGRPTEVQVGAWPEIAAGRHVLAVAPTGSGKTLAAFLWAIDRLLTGHWQTGGTRLLYVSPLKALNTDVRLNLLEPLAELYSRFRDAGVAVPRLGVMTRSGDTPAAERRRMLRRPPEILITTPESLNLLLTSTSGSRVLAGLRSVILDEIHAVAGSRRGTHLITAVERLVLLGGELQRVALSATVRPLERVAEFVAGYAPGRGGGAPLGKRAITIVQSHEPKAYDLRICFPAAAAAPDGGGADAWAPLTAALRERIRNNRSTLLFVNSRRMAEKLARLLNEGGPTEIAFAHHGSLSREIRAVVETRLKEGRLEAIVATSSLELGIDIGQLDEVILVQTPPLVAAATQRVGRAGHAVGQISRGRMFPLHAGDLLEAAVVARAVLDGEIEELRPVRAPLDVLAQVIVSMTSTRAWGVDALYEAVCAAEPYHELSRRQYDLVLEMLAGRYADTRLPALQPRVALDRVDNTVRANAGASRLALTAGGTIPDRGYFALRVADSGAKLGELDEEFVWERSVGDSFVFGAQSWRIQRITHNDVLVHPAAKRVSFMAPFWRAEELARGSHLSERIGRFLEQAEAHLARGEKAALLGELEARYCLEPAAAERLVDHLQAQRAATGVALPHRRHLVVEHLRQPGAGRSQVVLHTLWGGQVNRALAMAMAAAWAGRHGGQLEVIHEDDSIIVTPPRPIGAEELLRLVEPADLERLLRARLEHSGLFGARFRESAGRALLLPRGTLARRLPLWLSRERSKHLLQAVSPYGDFPLVLEAWRTCIEEELDLPTLRARLAELGRGDIEVSEARTTSPSPFAAQVIWKQTNRAMYDDDVPVDTGTERLRPDLLREVVFTPHLRPRVPPSMVQSLERKLQRTQVGYAPHDAAEVVDWVKQRVLVPEPEWEELVAAVERDHGLPRRALLDACAGKLVGLAAGGMESRGICAVEVLPRLGVALAIAMTAPSQLSLLGDAGSPAPERALDALARLARRAPRGTPAEVTAALVAEWMRFYGPLTLSRLRASFGLEADRAARALDSLVEAQQVVVDELTAGAAELEVCDAENLERLLRLVRAGARPAFEPLPAEQLPLFLAQEQGLLVRGSGEEQARGVMERLFAFAAPAAAWEAELLPARLEGYRGSWLDRLLEQTGLLWVGCGQGRLTFLLESDLDLLAAGRSPRAAPPALRALFPDVPGSFSIADLAQHSGLGTAAVSQAVWELAWAGWITSDSFAPVRQGILTRFANEAPAGPDSHRRAGARRAFSRWHSTRALGGRWAPVPWTAGHLETEDALDEEQRARERARLLLDRYGIVFRELVAHELPALRWSRLFTSLRLMELSGEVLSGHFFTGVTGPQFMTAAAFRRLTGGIAEDEIYFISAVDPASPCGLGIEGLPRGLPPRRAGNHVVFCGRRPVVVSRAGGKELRIDAQPLEPRLPEYLESLRWLLDRDQESARVITVERINGEPATRSAFQEALAAVFSLERGPRSIQLGRKR